MKITIISILLACSSFYLNAQNSLHEPCGFDQYIRQHKKMAADFESGIQKFLYTQKMNSQCRNVTEHIKTIPVVVHIIHNNGSENISDAQVASQIQVMNEDYRKIPFTNGDGNGVDMEIQFCLAKITPEGACTNGIVRIQSTLTNLQPVRDAQMKALSHWDPSRYLNIYVVKTISGGTLGYASFPGGPPNEDGIVCVHNYFGNIGTALVSHGRTTTHESGHWFGLYHTFNGGCGSDICTEGDYVCDTPPVNNPNFGCPSFNSCNNDFPDVNDQVQNYMDYTTDVCKNMFTEGQKARSQATLDTVRTNIWQPSTIISTGCDSSYSSPPCPAVSDFTSNGQTICEGNSVLFINRSLNDCTSYQWYFPGGTPSTSTSVNQIVTYSSVGAYDVSLVATNITGSDSVTYANYITVITPPVGQSLTFSESFETTTFPSNGITIDNPDAGITWERDTVAVPYEGLASAKINNLINTNYGQTDAMLLPNLNLASFIGTPYMTFRWAYAKSDVNYSDELAVQISTDCGVNFTQIFYRTGNALATGPTQTTPYIPDNTTIWKLAKVSLASYASSDHAIIKLINVTDGGNNLYIDSINIGPSITVGIEENASDENSVELYPNPAGNEVQLKINNRQLENGTINIYSMVGEQVFNEKIETPTMKLRIENFPAGVYYVNLRSGDFYIIEKLVVQ